VAVSGTDEAVASYLQWCAHGPPHARVDQVVECIDDAAEALGKSFEILPTR
jgi:acylphosphatase